MQSHASPEPWLKRTSTSIFTVLFLKKLKSIQHKAQTFQTRLISQQQRSSTVPNPAAGHTLPHSVFKALLPLRRGYSGVIFPSCWRQAPPSWPRRQRVPSLARAAPAHGAPWRAAMVPPRRLPVKASVSAVTLSSGTAGFPWTVLQVKVPSFPSALLYMQQEARYLWPRLWACASGPAAKCVFVQNGASEVVFSKASKGKCAPCSFLACSPARRIPAIKILWCKAARQARVTAVGTHWAQYSEGHCGFLAIKLLCTWHSPVRRWENTVWATDVLSCGQWLTQ